MVLSGPHFCEFKIILYSLGGDQEPPVAATEALAVSQVCEPLRVWEKDTGGYCPLTEDQRYRAQAYSP